MKSLNKLRAISRTTEVNAVAERIITEYEQTDWNSDSHLTGIFNLLKPENEKLTQAVNQIKAVSNLEEKDEIRDEKVRAIYYLLTGYLHHPDTIIKLAAQNVDKVFEHYGVGLTQKNYASESSLVESLLNHFTDASIKSSIEALPGLPELINELNSAQNDFELALIIYNDEKAEEGTKENATQLKKTIVEIINNNLIVYLRAMIQVDKTKYGEFCRSISELIDENNEVVNKRKKKDEAKSE